MVFNSTLCFPRVAIDANHSMAFCDDLHDTDDGKNPIIVSHLLFGIGLLDGEWLRHIDGSAIGDHDVLGWLVASVGLRAFDLSDDIHSLDDFSEDDVTSVEPSCLLGSDEELRSVCVFSCVESEKENEERWGKREREENLPALAIDNHPLP
jgi:hypothetical protein